jgi:hypothetical protein
MFTILDCLKIKKKNMTAKKKMHILCKFYSLFKVIVLSNMLGLCYSLFNTDIIARLTFLIMHVGNFRRLKSSKML